MEIRGAGSAELLARLHGCRVTLRHRLATHDGRPLFTDSVGELESEGRPDLLVHTRRGPVRVAREAVVAVREIPPPRARRASWAAVSRLERLCADAWPAVVDRPLGQWRLRAAGGFTGRANSTLVVGDPGRPTPEALAEAVGFAAQHGLRPRAQVPRDSPWHERLAEHGWRLDESHAPGAEVSVQVTELAQLAGRSAGTDSEPGELAKWPGVAPRIDPRPDADWWRLTVEEQQPSEAARHVLTAPALADRDAMGFGVARDGPTAVGAVRLALVDGHLHVARLWVAHEYRKAGVGSALMRAGARWAMDRGAQWCVLQVAEHNVPAMALYRRLGFRQHHRYIYLVPPG